MPRAESDDTDITDDEIIPKQKASALSRKNKNKNKKVVKSIEPSEPVVSPTTWRRLIHWLENSNNLGYLQGLLVINTILVKFNPKQFSDQNSHSFNLVISKN